MTDPALYVDRGHVFSVPYTAHERVILTQQAKYDRRFIPRVWFWRFLGLDDEGGASPDDVLWESLEVQRRYAPPIAVHIYLDDSPNTKGEKKGVTETTGTAPIGWSRAEARRVGQLLHTADDREGVVNDEARADYLYVPRPGDVFAYRRDFIYRVQQMKREWLATTSLVTVWKGTASLVRGDGVKSITDILPAAPTPEPALVLAGRPAR